MGASMREKMELVPPLNLIPEVFRKSLQKANHHGILIAMQTILQKIQEIIVGMLLCGIRALGRFFETL
jgi:hypothetical protein